MTRESVQREIEREELAFMVGRSLVVVYGAKIPFSREERIRVYRNLLDRSKLTAGQCDLARRAILAMGGTLE